MIRSTTDVTVGCGQAVEDNGLWEDVLDIRKEGVRVDEGRRIWITADIGYIGVAYVVVSGWVGQGHGPRDVVGLFISMLGSCETYLQDGTTHLETDSILGQNAGIQRNELSRSDHSGARDSQDELMRFILIRECVVGRGQRLR